MIWQSKMLIIFICLSHTSLKCYESFCYNIKKKEKEIQTLNNTSKNRICIVENKYFIMEYLKSEKKNDRDLCYYIKFIVVRLIFNHCPNATINTKLDQ